VVHGADGIDELSTTGYTKVSEARDGDVRTFYVHPADFGLAKAEPTALRGGGAEANAAIVRAVLAGVAGAPRDVVLLNAGAALFIAERAGSVRAGIGNGRCRGGFRCGTCHARSPRGRVERGTAFMSAQPDLLATIVAATERITLVRREREPLAVLERRAAAMTPAGARFEAALGATGRTNVIAECKRRSPSRGVLVNRYDPVAIATQYEAGGAAAISVLTEPTFFDGALEHLAAVRQAVSLPLLRKDFVVDAYQLLEARAAGADAVLLIVAALDQDELEDLQQRAWDLGLAVLVEVHDDEELSRAVDAGARLIGVNNRNLRTLAVDLAASDRLAAANAVQCRGGERERTANRAPSSTGWRRPATARS
jgi:indole-3-glycerol phosphate synthase